MVSDIELMNRYYYGVDLTIEEKRRLKDAFKRGLVQITRELELLNHTRELELLDLTREMELIDYRVEFEKEVHEFLQANALGRHNTPRKVVELVEGVKNIFESYAREGKHIIQEGENGEIYQAVGLRFEVTNTEFCVELIWHEL